MYVAWKVRRVPIFALSWWAQSRGDGHPYRKSERDAITTEVRAQKKAEMAKKKKAMALAMAKKKKMKAKSTKTKKKEQKIQEVEMKPINSTNLSNDVVWFRFWSIKYPNDGGQPIHKIIREAIGSKGALSKLRTMMCQKI